MKVSDYMIQFFIDKGITDGFGYPGGMVTPLMDSFAKREDKICAHITYHEQAAAFAACAYAQVTGRPGVAYATSGPGATNLITGICNAFFDSLPVIFLTGQVNSFEAKGDLKIRQRGFQETDIVSMVRNVTKYAVYADRADKIKYYLERAYDTALKGRRGPVLLDIPMDVLRSEIHPEGLTGWDEYDNATEDKGVCEQYRCKLKELRTVTERELSTAKRPCILLGNGIKLAGMKRECRLMVSKWRIPAVSSMPGMDILSGSAGGDTDYYGFIGSYGNRTANFILAKSDLVIALGTRLDIRQVGAAREQFAAKAKIIRVDIDSGELEYKIREDDLSYELDLKDAIPELIKIPYALSDPSWKQVCEVIRTKLANIDDREVNRYMKVLSGLIPDHRIITTDVGQNQVWTAQSFHAREHQEVLFTGGHGAMGYALPAAIGAYYGGKKPVICMSGDGGFQMNIQELQYISREKLPIKMMLWNNAALGMIRHFQEMYFEERYTQTVAEGGYTVPDFCAVAGAYGIRSRRIRRWEELSQIDFEDGIPELIEIILTGKTYVYPKLEYGKPNQDQEPLLERSLYDYLMDL